MPAVPLTYRSICGSFAAVFICFMAKRETKRLAMRIKVVTLRRRSTGVLVGILLTLLFFGDLLHRCGDIEENPGPRTGRQTRLTSCGKIASNDDSPPSSSRQPTDGKAERTLDDVMDTLLKMNSNLDSKLDSLQDDVRRTKEVCDSLKNEMMQLKGEVADLRQENDALRKTCDELNNKVDSLEQKNDEFENRMKRNNIIIHGIPRDDQEKTWQDCEGRVRDLIIDRLELSGEIEFDRVHRLSPRKDSPIIAMCTLYKDKEDILRARNKLKGTKIFIGEDFSKKVRNIRTRLIPHLKQAKSKGKRATMVFDHLIIEGKKFGITEDNKLFQLR